MREGASDVSWCEAHPLHVSERAGTVTRIDPRSGTIVGSIPVGNGPSALVAGEGAVWVVNRHDGTLSRIDPATNTVSGTAPVGSDPTAVTAGNGAVWVAGGEERIVSRVDPGTLRVRDRIPVGSSPGAIASAPGAVWTAGVAPPASHRGGTLRVRIPTGENFLTQIDWLHPLGWSWGTAHITSLAYDGLVGYRRVGGVAGATLVGALATSAPEPSRDGRTYVFTLRPNLRFSDGRAVGPEDFRASIERMLVVTRGNPPPYFTNIPGALRCAGQPRRCDLSTAIETNEQARTITIHLIRPDADFLHKLTTAFAYVVPADTPVRSTGDRAPPGTGAYRIAAWNSSRGGLLVRNPYFRSRSPQARTAGFADRIEIGLQSTDDIEAQIAEVQHGDADVLVLADPFGTHVAATRIRALEASSPGQVHSAPAGSADWMFLNVTRRPFDDPRVRQALNYATDRNRIVTLAGGSAVAAATCQAVPSGMPGYVPYCPYTANSGPGRPWTAPDLERARELVAASGTAGERIVVLVPGFRRPIGRYFTTLLDELGFRASLRVLSQMEYFTAVYEPRSRAQIGFMGWSLDYMSPANFVEPHFSCTSAAERDHNNLSRLCDPSLALQTAHASNTDTTPARWAAVDRRIVDLAPAVPMTNRRTLVFVSKRVGNVQSHQMWSTLLDQLWIR